MNKADALERLDLAVQFCLEVGLSELQLRHAIVKAVNDTGGPLVFDESLERKWDGSQHVWHIRLNWLRERR